MSLILAAFLAPAVPGILAAASVASLGLGVQSAVAGRRAQRRSLREQAEAQRVATAQAQRTARANAEEMRRIEPRKPDVAAMLARSLAASTKPPATQLTSTNKLGG